MMINIHIQVMPLYLLDLGPAHFKRLNYTSPMQTKEPDLVLVPRPRWLQVTSLTSEDF